ncbi:MAG: hypothetical protein HY348_13510 [Nitrospira defluvii]|nr:hypothetical protein [Nitrospira defluvii]
MQQRFIDVSPSRRRVWRIGVRLLGLLAVSLMLVLGQSAQATVQLLPEMLLKREGQIIIDAKAIRADPAVTEILLAFDRAEKALQKQDLAAMMQFYAPGYNYHALHVADVERIWSEVFEHYRQLSSTHLFSDMQVVQTSDGTRVEVTCTGGLYGTEVQSGARITLDSWFQEVHYLIRDKGGWRFLGNKGGVPRSAPFSSSPHHPLF